MKTMKFGGEDLPEASALPGAQERAAVLPEPGEDHPPRGELARERSGNGEDVLRAGDVIEVDERGRQRRRDDWVRRCVSRQGGEDQGARSIPRLNIPDSFQKRIPGAGQGRRREFVLLEATER